MKKNLQVLILEDSPDDAELLLHELCRAGFEPEWKRVMNEPDFLAQLDHDWEIILADYSMPQFSGLRALELLKARGLDIPLVLISGTIGEDVAVGALRAGAGDYLLKGQLARLGQVVERELRDVAERRGSTPPFPRPPVRPPALHGPAKQREAPTTAVTPKENS